MDNRDETYKAILDNIHDGVYFVDTERRITYWNKGAERISGYTSQQVMGRRCMDNLLNHVTENGTQLCLKGCPLHATIQDGKPREAEIYLHHTDGHRVPVLVHTSPIRDQDGAIIGAVETFSDNTSHLNTRRRVNRLEQTVLTDPGTGIGNRRFIEIRLSSALMEFHNHHIPFGVLFIDIDHFKDINDTYGHLIGDRILRMVAKTLQYSMRASDAMARWGGEEFIALLPGVSRQDLMGVGQELRHLVENSLLSVDDQVVGVTISVGATHVRPEDSVESLIRRADQYMYASKQAGRNHITGDGTRRGERAE
jgi:diguanylate cyclase (GGDEF)-like protein/PAS domain S-box-containing protein